MQAARRRSREVFRDERELAELREALEREQDLRARAVHDAAQHAAVFLEQPAVHQVARRGHAVQVELGKFFDETVGHLPLILRQSAFPRKRGKGYEVTRL